MKAISTLAVCLLALSVPSFAQELSTYAAPDEVVRALASELASAMIAGRGKLIPCPAQNGRVFVQRGHILCEIRYPERWIGRTELGWRFTPLKESAFAGLSLGRDSFLVDRSRTGDAATLGRLMERGALVADRDAQRANELVRAQAGAEAIGRLIPVPSLDRVFPR